MQALSASRELVGSQLCIIAVARRRAEPSPHAKGILMRLLSEWAHYKKGLHGAISNMHRRAYVGEEHLLYCALVQSGT